MMKTLSFDIDYLCSKMSDMSGLPIRIYRNSVMKSSFAVIPFVKDPIDLRYGEMEKYRDHVNYHITENSSYYGIINSADLKIIIGPGRSLPYSDQELHDLAFALDVHPKDTEAFISAMRSITPIPLDSIIQMMCSLNHILNGEKLNVSDFQIKGTKIQEKMDERTPAAQSDIYKNYNIEKQVLDIVRTGDLKTFEQWTKNAPTVRPGQMSSNVIRQNKNTFIVITTLISRAAIEAGMKIEDAFALSDSFIQRCENTDDLELFTKLEYELVYTYTKEVRRLKDSSGSSTLSNEVYHYILHNISRPIRTKDIADALYLSRSHLSTMFKKQCGIALNDYIHTIKTEKAKELLKDRSKSVTLISNYLGYSSSSHFDRIFRKMTGSSPKEYRDSQPN